ncbi:DNA polymerase III subunit alpha [Mucilaginibacter sp. OK098]|uniref:DNA polymerase III subunit alpha n=1 Tax=Mucilaginibacter sp. OK098 TaxID=1855297 RepID=UPI00090F9B37|nr:PHP domain-containing protein [Mucilaginibacter sp. OK098]SHN00797.1 DNA polymerase-3 subunit alpha [Mucilaginibacter sp. OK098]
MYLNTHSQFSLRYGTMDIKAIVKGAKACGIEQLALTDINNSSGIMEFVRLAEKEGVKPIAGMEFHRDKQLLYIGIARNREGFKELNDFLTFHNVNHQPLPDQPWDFQNAYVIYPFTGDTDLALKENEYIGIRYEQLNSLFGRPLAKIKDKLVALCPVTVSDKIEYRLHEYLRAIDLSTLLTKVGESYKCRPNEMFLPPDDLRRQFSMYPFIISNTEKVMMACDIKVPDEKSRNKKTFTGSMQGDYDRLRELTMEGMLYRFGTGHEKALKKIEEELLVIRDQGFAPYFLITHDITTHFMKKGYYHVGRGSGANSTVAYCLRITDVDPMELDLYFERFLNKSRTSPPDFDIDYSWDQRVEVQQYIFDKYTYQHVALLGTMSTFKDRSVIREIGKVMGLPPAEIDSFTDRSINDQRENNPAFKKIMAVHDRMKNMPNQRSIHAGGVLISEEPITYFTALDMPPKGMQTVQWDMYEAEAIGFEKFDILSQRGIGHIKEAAQLIEDNKGEKVDIHDFRRFKSDGVINTQLKTSDSIGCFYIESPAMRQLLRKLQCGDYLTLVAASSIIRPGVAQSGMMQAYIRNFHNPENVVYLHPVMKEQLEETYGVMVYQEDVIKVCIHFAGMDGSDADILRRGMSGKYRSKIEFDKLVDKFFIGAKALGRSDDITAEVWRQVSSFAGYSFSKAHSASFAVESYQSLFLKTYYPMEFMVAVLNNYGGFYSRWLYVHELQKAGARVQLPCVNHSETTVGIKGVDAFLGLIGISGLENRFIESIPEERHMNGPFCGLEDFIKRTSITLEQCITLIRVGALRFTGSSKKELLWEVHNYLGSKPPPKPVNELFNIPAKACQLPELVNTALEDAYNELELLGYPVTLTMFDLLRSSFRGDVMTKDLVAHTGKIVRMVGNYVCEKTVHTKNNKLMWFGTFLDAQGDFFDTTHFPDATPGYPFKGKGCYLIEGKVVQDFGFPSVEVLKFFKLRIKDNPVYY